MILFIVSFLLVFTSSYFITSILVPKKSILGFIYLFTIAFAQIVLTFEILSLFTAINEVLVLVLNIGFLCLSAFVWNKMQRPIWSLEFADFRNRLLNSITLDKSLMVLYVGFLVFIIVSVFLCFLMPITSADAQSYHVARSLFWVFQGSLNHFDTPDVRNLCLPINSEILYSWVLLFVKTDAFLGFFSFVGYLLSIVSIYNILGLSGFCVRKRLWAIFILTSSASVIVQASGTETDIIIAGLISSSIFLFWYGIKKNEEIPIFMASLCYALALGTKTPAFLAIPGVGLLFLALCHYYKKYSPIKEFLIFGIINFIIFSSYNYVLNFIHYSNFFGTQSFLVVSKNFYGIKGAISNFIKYFFMMIDLTGLRWSDYVGDAVSNARTVVLKFVHLGYIPDGIYTFKYGVNRSLLEPVMGPGILGIIVFLPTLFYSLIRPIFKNNSKKTWVLFSFALLFILNLIAISYFLAYMVFSIRFITFFIVLSSPILVYSYFSNKNPIKYVFVIFSMFYLIGVSTHLWPRPFYKIARLLIEHKSISYVRDRAECKDYEEIAMYSNRGCVLKRRIKEMFPKGTKILMFLNTSDYLYIAKTLEYEGYKLDFRTYEDVDKIDFSKYNVIVSTNKGQVSTVIKDYDRRKNSFKIKGKKIYFTEKYDAPCFYMKNDNVVKTKIKEAMYPYQVRCGMSRDFMIKQHLKQIGIAGIYVPYEEEFNYYTIYKNFGAKS